MADLSVAEILMHTQIDERNVKLFATQNMHKITSICGKKLQK
jgi:hypothetical protein